MQETNTIWFEGFPLALARKLAEDCMIGHLGIELLEAGRDYLKGRMPVDERTRQPLGLLHGGASVALAETLASMAAAFTLDRSKHYGVGLEINANHLRPVEEGFVVGVARPCHLGRTTQVWQVQIHDRNDRLVCISRVTMAIRDMPG
jgi:1,4-dihydroxy-2-naphthoyl-CoA hydrolase